MATDSVPKSLDSVTISRVEEIKKKLTGAHQTHKNWLQCGTWLRSGVVCYEGPDGRKREWETVERTTRKGPVDGTDIFSANLNPRPVLLVIYIPPSSGDWWEGQWREECVPCSCIQTTYWQVSFLLWVLLLNPTLCLWEPAIIYSLVHTAIFSSRICLEFPSGLMEEGESLECAALRELGEETGHTGTVTVRVWEGSCLCLLCSGIMYNSGNKPWTAYWSLEKQWECFSMYRYNIT